jgi:hypothetical protein
MTSISDTKEKEKLRKEKLSGYFLDMSKLTFGATVLSGILPAFKSATVVDVIYTITGLVGTIWLYMIGRNILLK